MPSPAISPKIAPSVRLPIRRRPMSVSRTPSTPSRVARSPSRPARLPSGPTPSITADTVATHDPVEVVRSKTRVYGATRLGGTRLMPAPLFGPVYVPTGTAMPKKSASTLRRTLAVAVTTDRLSVPVRSTCQSWPPAQAPTPGCA